MEPDLGACLEERLDQPRAQPVVDLRREAVLHVAVAGEEEVGRARPAGALELGDAGEAPVGITAAEAVHRDGRQAAGLAKRVPPGAGARAGGEAAYRVPNAPTRPAPGPVDVVGERDREAGAAPAGRLDPQTRAQPLQRRVERVEGRGGGRETAMAVALPAALLEPGQMPEGAGELVALGALSPLDLRPGAGVVGHLLADGELAGAERVEHPAGPRLGVGGDHGIARRTTRPRFVSAGRRSSRATTPST